MTGMSARLPSPDLFKGVHFDDEVVILCLRWYVTYKLSSRELVSMMGERGTELAHTTILRWVQRYIPEFEKRWNRYARPVGGSWRCDETYIKVKGRWTYLYRAVDKQGRTVDFLLTAKGDVAATKRFFQKAMTGNGTPRVIMLDAYAASHRGGSGAKSRGKDAEASAGPFLQVSRVRASYFRAPHRPISRCECRPSNPDRDARVGSSYQIYVVV